MTRKLTCALLVSGMMLTTAVHANAANTQVDSRDVVRDARGDVVINTFGNCVRTQWVAGRDECRPYASSEHRVSGISREERTVYFEFDKSRLTPAAQDRLDTLAGNLTADENVRGALVAGYADRIGRTSYNESLSKRRAETVKDYLISKGVVNARVTDTRWYGETEPSTNCPDTLSRSKLIECLQRDRKVEVDIDYHAEGQASE